MNYELKKLAEWFKSNKLSLNSGKLQKKQKKTKKKLAQTNGILSRICHYLPQILVFQ